VLLATPSAFRGKPDCGSVLLPPGVLTLYEQVVAGEVTDLGDARLAVFPLGEKRMLSYAVDAKVTVDRSSEEQHAIVKAAVAQRVMRLTRLARQITTYRLKAASDGEHRLLIEHPRLAGWSLALPEPTSVELTADAYRIPVTLNGNKPNNVTVTMERPLEETTSFLTLRTIASACLLLQTSSNLRSRRPLGSSPRGGKRSDGRTMS
jgi:hypothetical protein